jgi:nucleoside-diphosphate-sugar epimerase
MKKEKILVIGACGQIGVELTLALRKLYGGTNVVASDLREENDLLKGTGPYVSIDVMNKEMLHVQVIRQNITQIYFIGCNSFSNWREKSTTCMAFEYPIIVKRIGYCQRGETR